MTKRFLVRPGHIGSLNDYDVHYISARQIMNLHGVDPRECVVLDPQRPASLPGYSDEYLSALLELKPHHIYFKVTEAERRQYPLGEK